MSGIFRLKDTAIIILAYMSQYIGDNTEDISVEEILNGVDRDRNLVIDTLLELKINNYIQQVTSMGEDELFWNNAKSRYKINEVYIHEIETFLRYDIKTNKVSINGEYIWYAVYGTGISLEKFLHYIRGGICRFNHREYEGCKDESVPLLNRPITIPYKAYIGGSSPLWQYKGTIFLDTKHSGITKGRMYLIKISQYEEIRDQIGRGKERYDEEVYLGEYFGIRIKTVTNKNNKIPSESSNKYKELMMLGLEEIYPHDVEENRNYIDSIFGYQVKLNVRKEYIQELWNKEVKEIMDRLESKQSSDKELMKLEDSLVTVNNDEPKRIITTTTLERYSKVVVAQRLLKSEGKCEKCGKKSPYYKETKGVGFLQIHYINPIENGGKDDVDNTIALCPNCKREAEIERDYSLNNWGINNRNTYI